MPAPVLQFKRGNAGVAGTVPALRPGEPAISLNNFDFFIGIDTSVANNKFFGSHRYWGREDGTNSLNLKLVDKDGTNYVAIKAPNTLAGNVTYTLPGTQGGSSSVLTNDGSGNLTWASGSANPVFTGIATFSDTTDNTLGDSNTGAVRIDGGLGIDKNVTVGGNLNVQGYSEFVGVVTFKGGTINIGDNNTDNINVSGEFISNLVPNTDDTYDIGITTQRWRDAHFSGIGSFATGAIADAVRIGYSAAGEIDTTSGNLVLSPASGRVVVNNHLDVNGDINATGNISLGGTTISLRGTDVFIENKDIILGFTTTITPDDDTANHAGVAIASTEGTPLVSFSSSGINTLPDTYKQMMWFQSGTLGFSTDVFAFNYGVAIGTTTVADGVRLAVGSGVTVSDTAVSATTFYGSLVGNVSSADQVKTVTASDTPGTYYVTFVDANNGSATNETVYTDDGIYYNPGTNTFTTQNASLTGNINVSGVSTLAGNVFLGDSGSDTITVAGVTTFTTSNVYIDNQLFVGGIQVIGGASVVGQDITARHINLSGIATVTGLIDGNGGADISGHTELDDVNVSGATTLTSLNATGNVTLGDTSGDTITVKGTATFEQPIVGTIGTATRATLVDTTGTSSNTDYFVTFVDTLAGQDSETIRVGYGLSVNPSTGNVGVASVLSVGNVNAVNAFIKAGGGSNALYLYSNGDVSFQAKAIVNEIRSSSNASTLITLNDLDATFANNVKIIGITTTSQLTVGTGVGITQFSASVSTGSSASSVPTSSAVIDYVTTQVGNVDLTTSIAGDSGSGSVNTSQTLTIAGTANEIETSASGQTITVGLPDAVVVGTSLSAPTVRANIIQSQNTGATAITINANDVTIADDLTVGGNLYVNGNTTQVNTTAITVEDRTIELGVVDGAAPSSATTWDLGVLFNYYTDAAKKSAVIWEQGDSRFKFASVLGADSNGTDVNTPQLTVTTFAPIEVGSLWVTDCAGTSQVISCTGTTRYLENITIDAGTF